ncbi:MAG: hypothetical protein K0R65_1326 [Crocinitomicaceae bacterium]|nr:hypothetical protein [Crocinitomicaceae bacterium]
MRKLILGIIATIAVSFASNAQNLEHRAINKAEAAARECMRGMNLQSDVRLISTATANLIWDYAHPSPNYFGYVVEVSARPICPPNQACIQVIYPVATVYVDCQGNVYDIQCNTPVIIEP